MIGVKYKVTAPEADYSGKVGAVQFSDGAAVIDDETHPAELAYCQGAGYVVEPVEPARAEPKRRAPAKKAESKDGDGDGKSAEQGDGDETDKETSK